MRSGTALRILEETPYEVKEEVRRVTNLKIEKMNEVFKKMKSKKIQLDSEFWLMPDPYKMCPRITRALGSLERGGIGKIKLIIN